MTEPEVVDPFEYERNMHEIVIFVPTRFLDRTYENETEDLFGQVSDLVFAWEEGQGKRDGWDAVVSAAPAMERAQAFVDRERLNEMAMRVWALENTWRSRGEIDLADSLWMAIMGRDRTSSDE